MSNAERKGELSNESREVTRRVHVCVFSWKDLQEDSVDGKLFFQFSPVSANSQLGFTFFFLSSSSSNRSSKFETAGFITHNCQTGRTITFELRGEANGECLAHGIINFALLSLTNDNP